MTKEKVVIDCNIDDEWSSFITSHNQDLSENDLSDLSENDLSDLSDNKSDLSENDLKEDLEDLDINLKEDILKVQNVW